MRCGASTSKASPAGVETSGQESCRVAVSSCSCRTVASAVALELGRRCSDAQLCALSGSAGE